MLLDLVDVMLNALSVVNLGSHLVLLFYSLGEGVDFEGGVVDVILFSNRWTTFRASLPQWRSTSLAPS